MILPLIFEANDKWNDLRADRVGDEFGYQFILKAGGNEYERIKDIKATNAAFILPIDFPKAMDVEDPNDARFISLGDLKKWEMAPSNPAAFEKANSIIKSALKNNKSGYIIIDELGKLELESNGLHESVSLAITETENSSDLHLILIIRTTLLEKAVAKYNLSDYLKMRNIT